MNRRMILIKVLSLGLMLIFPLSSFSSTDAGETVTKRGIIDDDYYAAGGTVDVDADIAGDLVVSGGDLFVGRRIQADVMAAGGSVNIKGEILDDVRTAGGDITIDANIGDDLLAAGGEIRVSSGAVIKGNAWLAGGDVLMAGTINNDLYIGSGSTRISGTIDGDVKLEGGEIQILEGAHIKGNLHYKSPNEAMIHPDAIITGNVTYEQVEWDHPHRGYGFFFLLTMLVSAIVLFLLFPGFTMSAARRIPDDPWKSLGIGFALLIVAPIVAVFLIGIVLGVWVGLSILAIYFVALLLGFLISCFFLGDWGARRLDKDVTTTGRRILSVAIAIIVLGFIQLIPVVGGLFTFALLLLGLGAGLMQLRNVYNQSTGLLTK